MNKILVVDDEKDLEVLIKQKLRKQIREGKYQFFFANDGIEALMVLNNDPSIQTILSDINMPRLDGLGLLLKVNEINPLIKTVILSAYGDMDNIRTAMNRGAFDFLTKPVNFEDLEITIDKTLAYVNQLQNTVQAIRENNILKMYVDPTVLQYMTRTEFAHDVTLNETIEATVVFIDICGFTAIAENEAPDLVVKLLNKYFDLIVKEISAVLARLGCSVDELETERRSAPMSGEALFLARAEVHLPEDVTAATVRKAIESLATDLMVDVALTERTGTRAGR
jgi:CheY-like chemotaxis protein